MGEGCWSEIKKDGKVIGLEASNVEVKKGSYADRVFSTNDPLEKEKILKEFRQETGAIE
jgi:hypothetical protein